MFAVRSDDDTNFRSNNNKLKFVFSNKFFYFSTNGNINFLYILLFVSNCWLHTFTVTCTCKAMASPRLCICFIPACDSEFHSYFIFLFFVSNCNGKFFQWIDFIRTETAKVVDSCAWQHIHTITWKCPDWEKTTFCEWMCSKYDITNGYFTYLSFSLTHTLVDDLTWRMRSRSFFFSAFTEFSTHKVRGVNRCPKKKTFNPNMWFPTQIENGNEYKFEISIATA